MTEGVVIVGGGASGTLTAVALARKPSLGPVTLVDAGTLRRCTGSTVE